MVIAAIQWGLGATGKTGNCNAVGMEEPHWGQISNFAGYATLIFDLVCLQLYLGFSLLTLA
jgi:hypothetical protein